MADIRKFAVAQTARLHLRDATDEPMMAGELPMMVNVFGPGSKQYAKATAAQQNRVMDLLKRKGKTDQSAEDKARENAEFLADCTESFENVDYNGLTGRELALAVYGDREIGFIADQVAKHLGDWGNFTKPSSQT